MKHTLFYFSLIISMTIHSMDNEMISLKEDKPLLDKEQSNSNSTSIYEFEKTLGGKWQSAETVAFDPNNSNALYAGSSDGKIKIWDINNNTFTQLPKGFDSQESDIIAISSNGTQLAVTGWCRDIALFNLTKKQFEKKLTTPKNKRAVDDYANYISCLTFHHKHDNILAAGLHGDGSVYGQSTNTVTIFNTESNKMDTLTANMRELRHIAMNPYDEQELIVTSDRKVAFWDIDRKECIREVNNEPSDSNCVHDIAFHPTQNVFLTCTNQSPYKFCSSLIDIWDANQQKKVRQICPKGFGEYGVSYLAMHPNGKEIIASAYRLTQIIDFGTGKIIQTFPNKSSFWSECFCSSPVNSPKHSHEIKQVAVSHDGEKLAILGESIKIWN